MSRTIIRIKRFHNKTNKAFIQKYESIKELAADDIELYEAIRDNHIFELDSNYIKLEGFRYNDTYNHLEILFL